MATININKTAKSATKLRVSKEVVDELAARTADYITRQVRKAEARAKARKCKTIQKMDILDALDHVE